MSKTGRQRGSVLVCKECRQELPDIMEKIPQSLDRLRKELGYGEKCKIKQSKG